MSVNKQARRLLIAAGFAVAMSVAPAFAVLAHPVGASVPGILACPAGEHEDSFTYACVPELGPGGPASGGQPVGAPSEESLTACSGRDRSQCLEEQLYGPGG